MTKLTLSRPAKLYMDALEACLHWLELGGEIKLASGHTLMMDEEARVGFKVFKSDGKGGPEEIWIMQLDSDVAWAMLIGHARTLTMNEVTIIQANLALNEIKF